MSDAYGTATPCAKSSVFDRMFRENETCWPRRSPSASVNPRNVAISPGMARIAPMSAMKKFSDMRSGYFSSARVSGMPLARAVTT